MKAYGGVDVLSHIFLISTLVVGEWSASDPCRITPGEKAPGNHWAGGWDSNFDTSAVQPVASYTDYATPARVVSLKVSRRLNIC
jgi:hypothetical protein